MRIRRASGPFAAVVLLVSGAGGGVVGAQTPSPCGSGSACYRLGRIASGGMRRHRFQEGMALAQARLAAHPDDPEGLFWLAVNTGAEALERGKLRALPALPEMERLLLRCHQVAPSYEHAGAARVLGRLYHKAPSVISIGSNAKARRWLETALAIDPSYPGNLAFAADFLADQRENERAIALARRSLMALDAGGEVYGPEGNEWRALAQAVVGSGS